MKPILPLDSAEVFFDGIFSEPRLRHPEGVAIDASGDIWCGGETGEIYRISADGSGIETVASTGGFILGLAFDDEQDLYACDMRHSAVFRLLLLRSPGRIARPPVPPLWDRSCQRRTGSSWSCL